MNAELTWLQKHEKIVLSIMLLTAVLWLGNKWLNNSAADAKTQAVIALQDAQQARLQAATAASQYQMTIDALSKQNASLAAAVAQRQVITEKQVTGVLTPGKTAIQAIQDLSTAYKGELNVDGTTVTPAGELAFPVPTVQRFSATKIERDAALADVADEKVIAANLQKEVDSGKNVITSLNGQIVADDTACKAQIKSIKDDARKSKRNWFVAGFLAGLGTRLLGHF